MKNCGYNMEHHLNLTFTIDPDNKTFGVNCLEPATGETWEDAYGINAYGVSSFAAGFEKEIQFWLTEWLADIKKKIQASKGEQNVASDISGRRMG